MPTLKLEELRVYQLSENTADAVWTIVRTWDSFARETVGKQLVRAADSIGANIAEGYGRGSFLDNRRFVKIARGSLYEVRHFLRRADKRHLITPESREILRPLLKALPPTLNAYLYSIGREQENPSEHSVADQPNDQ
jgi:four helix bundle protein